MKTLPISIPKKSSLYIGRFAPSPSGRLHFGSLVAAVGSYLQTRANNGRWLVRIEDIDPPREIEGATTDILNTLNLYGLHWDGEVTYQSQHNEYYHLMLAWLAQNKRSYLCQCSRKQVSQHSRHPGIYNRTCRSLSLSQANCAIRYKNDTPIQHFKDQLQGLVSTSTPSGIADDFIIHRRDGLFAYQLAVVVDDLMQGITEVVRGCDLLSTTLHQMTLYQAFGQTPINYLHLPIAVTEPGKKLSKQNHASPVDAKHRHQTLVDVLTFLGMTDAHTMINESIEDILLWATSQWHVSHLPRQHEIQV